MFGPPTEIVPFDSFASLRARADEPAFRAALERPLDGLREMARKAPTARALVEFLIRKRPVRTVAELVQFPRADELCDRSVSATARRALVVALGEHAAKVAAQPAASPPATSVGDVGPHLTHAGIVAWARARGVSRALDAPLEILTEFGAKWPRGGPYALGRIRTVSDLLANEDPGLGRDVAPSLPALRKVAFEWLRQSVAVRERALAKERARLEHAAPRDPAMRRLREHLLASREPIRRTIEPPLYHSVQRQLAVSEEPPALVFREPHSLGLFPVEVRIPLEVDGPPPSCSRCPPAAACEHRLIALDVCLAAVDDDDEIARRAAKAFARPAWERVLSQVDDALARAAAPSRPRDEADERIVFVLRAPSYPGGGFELAPHAQVRNKRGDFSRPRAVSASRLEAQRDLGEPTQTVVDMLGHTTGYPSRLPSLIHRALSHLVGHAHVYFAPAGTNAPSATPFEVRRGAIEIAVEETEANDGAVRLGVVLDGERVPRERFAAMSLAEPAGGVGVLVDEPRGRIVIVSLTPEEAHVLRLFVAAPAFPKEAQALLADRLEKIGRAIPVSLPAGMRGRAVAATATPLLQLCAEGVALRVEIGVRPLPEVRVYPPGDGPREVVAQRAGERVFATRDLDEERRAATGLAVRLGFDVNGVGDGPSSGGLRFERVGDAALDLLGVIPPLVEAGLCQIAWSSEPRRVVARVANVSDLRVRVADENDWFGVQGELAIDGERIEMSRVLEAIRSGRRFVEVASGHAFVALSDELRERLARAADVIFVSRGRLEVSPFGAQALAELAELGGELVAPPRFLELLARIRAAGDYEPPPPNVTAQLRDYQVAGYRWLARHAAWGVGACLADDMGLGKTVQALALLAHRAALGPAIVVAPTSVAWNWAREAQRFAPSLRVVLHRDGDRAQLLASLGRGDLLVTSYGLLVREARALAQVRFATAIFDEAQALKNSATQRVKAAHALEADFRVALTGTPVENHLGELWSLFRVVAPGLLGSWEQFRERFAQPIERDRDPGRRAALAHLVAPFLLRREKRHVARELPARSEIREEIALSPKERALYDDARLAAVAQLADALPDVPNEQRRFQVLAAITRLRQLASHPRLVDAASDVPSSKLSRLLELVRELREGGHRALVFSQFVKHLSLVREALDAEQISYLYLDGQTPEPERRARVDEFQAGAADLFLISLKAGGTGLNLTAADYVIHLDPWWNPAVEDQATDRAHRIGQTKPVTVYRLVSRGTIEEAILALHERKRDLVAGVLDGSGAAAAITTDELLSLLEGGGATPVASEPDVASPASREAAPTIAEVPRAALPSPSRPVHPPPLPAASRVLAPVQPIAGKSVKAPAAVSPSTSGSPSPVEAPPLVPPAVARPAAPPPPVEAPPLVPPAAASPPASPSLAADLERFREFLAGEVKAQRIANGGTVKIYLRALERFRAFVERERIEVVPGAPFDALRERYLDAIERNLVEAPKSDLILGATALRRFGAFLAVGAPERR